MIAISKLFKYSSTWEKMQFYLGVLFAILNGFVAPFYAFVLGIMFELFNPATPEDEKP